MGFGSELLVPNELIHLYTEHSWLKHAREVFDDSLYKDVDTMIAGYAADDRAKPAFEIFTILSCTSFATIGCLPAEQFLKGLLNEDGKFLGLSSSPIEVWKDDSCVEQSITDIWLVV